MGGIIDFYIESLNKQWTFCPYDNSQWPYMYLTHAPLIIDFILGMLSISTKIKTPPLSLLTYIQCALNISLSFFLERLMKDTLKLPNKFVWGVVREFDQSFATSLYKFPLLYFP